MRSTSDERSRPARRAGGARAWLLGVALAVAALLIGARAEAQSVTVTNPTVNRTTPDGGSTLLQRDTGNTLFYISYEDCVQNVELDFPVSVTGDTTGFQVWATASGDCTSSTSRVTSFQGTSAANCYELAPAYPTNGVVTFKAQDLIFKVFGFQGCVDTTGQVFNAASSTAPQPVNIYFLLTTAGDPVPMGSFYEWTQTQVDLLGPASPSPVTVQAGDQQLIMSLPTNTDQDLLGYFLFCNPPPGSDAGIQGTGGFGGAGTTTTTTTTTVGAGGAGGSGGAVADAGVDDAGADAHDAGGTGGTGGAGGTGGTGGTGGAMTNCVGNVSIPFLDPNHPDPTDPRVQPYICGSSPISPSSTMPTITGLQNGQEYVIAVAGYDEVDNVGPISVVQCGTPQATDTFFNQYCADGGKGCGGCGSCAVGSDGDVTWTVLSSSALLGVGLGLRRARRRRKRGAEPAVSE